VTVAIQKQRRYTGFETQSAWESARADKLRAKLFELLGRCCAECGDTFQLEVNHIYRRDWQPRKLSKYRRNLRYLREAKEQLVNLLCRSCNASYRPLPLEAKALTDDASNPF
jgi:5-methylcytosine-specific restriction endonuclease McrA